MSPHAVRFLPLLAALVAGCGEQASSRVYRESQGQGGGSDITPRKTPQAPEAAKPDLVNEALPAPPAGGDPAVAKQPAAERKIIYTAHLDVVVKDLDEAVKATAGLVAEHAAYVAKSEVRSDAGARRTASYTVRVPVAAFDKLRDALATLGTAERNATDSQDVTEEYVDVAARVKNLKAEEETLNRLLKDQAVRLDDVLRIRTQITAVRGDIERAEARLKYLGALSALSTVHLTLREVKDYKPPTAPTFGSRVSGAFSDSLAALREFGEGVAIFAVAVAPWLPLLFAVGYGFVRGVGALVRVAFAAPQRPAVAVPVRPANPERPAGE